MHQIHQNAPLPPTTRWSSTPNRQSVYLRQESAFSENVICDLVNP